MRVGLWRFCLYMGYTTTSCGLDKNSAFALPLQHLFICIFSGSYREQNKKYRGKQRERFCGQEEDSSSRYIGRARWDRRGVFTFIFRTRAAFGGCHRARHHTALALLLASAVKAFDVPTLRGCSEGSLTIFNGAPKSPSPTGSLERPLLLSFFYPAFPFPTQISFFGSLFLFSHFLLLNFDDWCFFP